MKTTQHITGAPIAVDTNDPNTTAPSETRVFQGPVTRDTVPTAAYVLAVGGSITVELWMYSTAAKRWFKVVAATACPADTLTYLTPIPPLEGGDLFLRVTVNSAGTELHVGFQGSR